MIEKRNKRYVKNGLSSSWERYTSNLEPNEDRIRFYLKVIEVDNLINPSLKLYKPEFNNLEHKHQVIDCLKRYEFKRGLLITLHVPSYLTFGRYSETSKLLNERNPEDYFYQIEQILQRFSELSSGKLRMIGFTPSPCRLKEVDPGAQEACLG